MNHCSGTSNIAINKKKRRRSPCGRIRARATTINGNIKRLFRFYHLLGSLCYCYSQFASSFVTSRNNYNRQRTTASPSRISSENRLLKIKSYEIHFTSSTTTHGMITDDDNIQSVDDHDKHMNYSSSTASSFSVSDHDDDDDDDTILISQQLPDNLILSLDLEPLLYDVANHAGTKRGRNALLKLVNIEEDWSSTSNSLMRRASSISSSFSSRRRRAIASTLAAPAKTSSDKNKRTRHHRDFEISPIAASHQDAQQEYDYVEQAMLCLNSDVNNDVGSLTYPPIYNVGSNPHDYMTIINDTDDDEWLYYQNNVDNWTLESILQAEKVIEKLLNVKEWAKQESIQTFTPLLAEIGCNIGSNNKENENDIENCDKNGVENLCSSELSSLSSVYNEIQNTVEIVRTRSLLDPSGTSVSASILVACSAVHVLPGLLLPTSSAISQQLDRLIVLLSFLTLFA